jgi:tetratricopeptide (TPR) repeat protein
VQTLEVSPPGTRPISPLSASAEQEKLNFFNGIARTLIRTSEKATLIIFLDDLMWADDASIELLGYVSRELHDKPILIIIAFRDVETDPRSALARYILQELREKHLREIHLKPVTETTITQIVHCIIGKAEIPADIVRFICAKTGGNPFFVEELSRSVSEQLQVSGNAERKTSEIEMPATVKALIQQRLLGLRTDTLETLKLAAVIGREFTFDLLRDVTELPDVGLVDQLEEALRARILRENKTLMESEVFTFLHALVHEFLLQEISLIRRRKYHMRVATLMEEKYPVLRNGQPDKLAFHYVRAGDYGKGLRYTLQAAESAQQIYAHADALALYGQALELVEDDHILTAQINERVGDLLILSGQSKEARASYESALKSVSISDNVWRSRLHRGICHTFTREHRYGDAHKACDKAENTLGREPNMNFQKWRTEWVDIQLERLAVWYWQGEVDQMAKLVEKIRPTVERYGSALQRGQFFQSLVSIVLRRDRYVGSQEAVANAQAALSASQESGNLRETAWSRFWLGFAMLWGGTLDAAEEQLLKSRDEAERSGDLGIQARCLNYLSLICRKRGRVEETHQYAKRTLEVASAAQMPEYVAMAKANLAWVAWRERDTMTSENEARAALGMLRPVPQGEVFAWTATWPLIGVMLEQERVAEAIEFARIMFEPKQQPLPSSLVSILKEAISAWESTEPEVARTSLHEALRRGREAGYT